MRVLRGVGLMVSLLALTNCTPTASQDEGVPPDADRALVTQAWTDRDVQATTKRLSEYDATLDTASAYVVRGKGTEAVVFPVRPGTSGILPFSEIVYERLGNGTKAVHVSGDGIEGAQNEGMVPSSPPAYEEGRIPGQGGETSLDCGGWGGWYTVGSHCGSSALCPFDGFNATFWDRRRERRCCSGGSCWTDYDQTTVRHKCGC